MSKKKKNQKKWMIAIGMVILISIVAVSIFYAVIPSITTSETGSQGLFGLLGGGGDYDTGVTADTETQTFEDLGVSGQKELINADVFYRIIDASMGSIAEVEAQGGFIVNANGNIEEWWIDPYMITKITRYWYNVYYKDVDNPNWALILGKQNGQIIIDGSRIAKTGDMEGNGLQDGWTMGLGPPPQFYDCNKLRFWVKTGVGNVPPYGSGCALKIELCCDVSWAADTKTKENILCASDEVYVAQEPQGGEEPGTPSGGNVLVIHTTPDAQVQVSQGGTWQTKYAESSGVATFDNIQTGKHSIAISKQGYYSQNIQITFPDTSEVTMVLKPIGSPGKNTLIVICFDGNADMQLFNEDDKNMINYFTNKYGDNRWENLPNGDYTLAVSKVGYNSQILVITMPGTGTIYVDLKKESTAPPEEPEEPPEKPEANQRPQIRTFIGPFSSDVGIDCEFFVTAIDADNDNLLYRFMWGDGISTGWSAETAMKHKYTMDGTYKVSVQVYDGELYASSNFLMITIGLPSGTGNELTTPLIEAENTQAGTFSTAKIRIMTNADEEDFDLKVIIKSPTGKYLLDESSIKKKKDGNLYVATVSYKCDEEGIVTISAQAISKTGELDDSIIMEKQIYSVMFGGIPTGENETGMPTEGTPGIPGYEVITLMVAIGIASIILRKRKQKL